MRRRFLMHDERNPLGLRYRGEVCALPQTPTRIALSAAQRGGVSGRLAAPTAGLLGGVGACPHSLRARPGTRLRPPADPPPPPARGSTSLLFGRRAEPPAVLGGCGGLPPLASHPLGNKAAPACSPPPEWRPARLDGAASRAAMPSRPQFFGGVGACPHSLRTRFGTRLRPTADPHPRCAARGSTSLLLGRLADPPATSGVWGLAPTRFAPARELFCRAP